MTSHRSSPLEQGTAHWNRDRPGEGGRDRESLTKHIDTNSPVGYLFFRKERSKNAVYAEDGYSFTFSSIVCTYLPCAAGCPLYSAGQRSHLHLNSGQDT